MGPLRWLLVKDLQILRRSPLVSALLVAYPIVIAVLIGFALSRGPDKPRVAFVNEVPAEQESVNLGTGEFTQQDAEDEICGRVECVDADSREEAREMVEDGEVLGALILPADLVDKLGSLTSLNPEQPTVDVLVTEEDPVKAQLVDDRIQAIVSEANLIVSKRISETAGSYLDLLIRGGELDIPLLGQAVNILGLDQAARSLEAISGEVPPGAPRSALEEVIRFAELARENLDLALPLLGAVAEPIVVNKEVISGDIPTLDSFAIAVAATVTLMFVTVLLVAGSLALEREENAYPRLVRGLVGPSGLLGEKLALGVAISLVVTLLMLAALSIFVEIDWGRIGPILAAIVAGGAGFAAFGAAIGGAAREVRASSLLAFMISLPIAFLSLVPSGTVSPALFDVIEVVTAAFPFDPALDALSGGLDESGPGLGLPLLHLAILAVAYGALARVSLLRFA
jgi:ABC-type multidrug transport system permease subunit